MLIANGWGLNGFKLMLLMLFEVITFAGLEPLAAGCSSVSFSF